MRFRMARHLCNESRQMDCSWLDFGTEGAEVLYVGLRVFLAGALARSPRDGRK